MIHNASQNNCVNLVSPKREMSLYQVNLHPYGCINQMMISCGRSVNKWPYLSAMQSERS